MKAIIKKLTCAILFLLPHYSFSQSGYTGATDIDVNGLFIGGTYAKAQVETKWGVATKYRSSMSEFGLDEVYDYFSTNQITNQFRFSDNGIFNSFSIRTSDFVVYAALDGGIKVGDKITRLKSLASSFGALVSKDENTYYFFVGEWDDPIVIKHAGGRITQISFVTSI